MWTEPSLLERFARPRAAALQQAMEEEEWEWNEETRENETFRTWFNEDWVADRWITFLDMLVDNLTVEEQMEVLTEYGLDDAFDLCRTIGVLDENISTASLVWRIMDHWYSYQGIMHTFDAFMKNEDENEDEAEDKWTDMEPMSKSNSTDIV